MLISPDFFIGEINVPNRRSNPISETLTIFISKYEPLCLQSLLGNELYAAYVASPTDQRILDIINGKTYDTNCKWQGLIYSSNFSLIADYIYAKYMEDASIWNSGFGTVIPKSDTTTSQSPQFKILNAWNSFSRQSTSLVKFLLANLDVYPEYDNDIATKALLFSYRRNEFDI